MNPYAVAASGTVDRAALLRRHSPRVRALDPRSPLQVGNGELAFTADVTGLQTLPDSYPVLDADGAVTGTLLGTMSQWGWHTTPFDSLPGVAPGTPAPRVETTLREYDSVRGPVPYVDLSTEQWGAPGGETGIDEEWLRANPHRLDLGRVSLWLAGGVAVADVTAIDQRLDLATGVLTSRFRVRGVAYAVTTAVHPERDELAVRIERAAAADGVAVLEEFGIELAFAYGSESWGGAQDWTRPEAHTTTVTTRDDGIIVARELDATRYTVALGLRGAEPSVPAAHRVRLTATGDVIDLVAGFASVPAVPPPPAARPTIPTGGTAGVVAAAGAWWGDFWSTGAAISFDGTPDPRAVELERRITLSQYLVAVNSAGSTPPAETGLMVNAWRGKFHLEMMWWHTAAFPLWGHPELLERSLAWYETILGSARATARRQGLSGARWPKQTDPSGTETPSSIGTFLVWQQPHPIYLAELLRRAQPDARTMRRWAPLVRETADFMASFAWHADDGYHLPAPLVPSQESYARARATTRDPTFELAYWAWALRTAVAWFERLGEPVPPLWAEVAQHVWRPRPRHGVYPAIGVDPWTIRTDHPSVLAALGVVPDTGLIDRETMAATLDDIAEADSAGGARWDWSSTWGWDYPMGAMTAARLGRPDAAVDWLMFDKGKNEYLPNGHNAQTPALPVYLPGNGGLLTAVALMAAGWDGAPERPAPGFPESWVVATEGFVRLP